MAPAAGRAKSRSTLGQRRIWWEHFFLFLTILCSRVPGQFQQKARPQVTFWLQHDNNRLPSFGGVCTSLALEETAKQIFSLRGGRARQSTESQGQVCAVS